ncbi:superoxide dismutase family protein [Phenylobacterium sp.]|uniref:superoxide dismutase family protein n=1 Tax=Phenylobacterium sp. TaxID=1871053 RepID=UPI0012041EE9|nr:superoxide dismutase family protein [Phenylobacterium sp.]THD52395.1 MAG: superoxide dismutase family protein [Phenylobacterium sp.]
MALGALSSSAQAATMATAQLVGVAGADTGSVTISQGPKGVVIQIAAKGLAPGWHAVHFHEAGSCAMPDFKSAGGHVHASAAHPHGLLNPEGDKAGDLPNIFVGADGAGSAQFYSTTVSLAGALGQVALLDADGCALVIHASADDFISQPIGGAGARVACGVLH